MRAASGIASPASQFDPACVAAALHNKAEFYAIYQQYQDPACTASVAASGAEPG